MTIILCMDEIDDINVRLGFSLTQGYFKSWTDGPSSRLPEITFPRSVGKKESWGHTL